MLKQKLERDDDSKKNHPALVNEDRLGRLGPLECGHHFFCKPFELLERNGLRHADRKAYRNAVERRIFLFESLDMLDEIIGIAAQEATGFDRILDARQS